MFGYRVLGAALAALSILAWQPGDSAAQSYPQKPVKLLVPGAAGGPTDVPARLVADGLSQLTGQRFVVEDRTGAGGVVAAEATSKAAPDGYTLLYANSSVMAVNPALYKNLSYDPAKAFTLIGFATNSPQLLIANKNLPYKTVPEMVAWAKAHPGKLNFATGGAGTLPHLTAELFKIETGIDAVIVHYNGGAPGATAVMAGQADVLFDLVRTRVKNGDVRALALTGQHRDPDLPDVPTMAEAGYPAVTSTSWTGLAAPAGTPKEIVTYLNTKLNQLVNSPEFKAKAAPIGLVPQGGTPEEFAAWAAKERERWTHVVKVSGATTN